MGLVGKKGLRAPSPLFHVRTVGSWLSVNWEGAPTRLCWCPGLGLTASRAMSMKFLLFISCPVLTTAGMDQDTFPVAALGSLSPLPLSLLSKCTVPCSDAKQNHLASHTHCCAFFPVTCAGHMC